MKIFSQSNESDTQLEKNAFENAILFTVSELWRGGARRDFFFFFLKILPSQPGRLLACYLGVTEDVLFGTGWVKEKKNDFIKLDTRSEWTI